MCEVRTRTVSARAERLADRGFTLQKCSVRPKSREVNEDGEQITHRYCGILCYEAAQRSISPSSTIPAPAASFEGRKPLKFCIERFDAPIGRKSGLIESIRRLWYLH